MSVAHGSLLREWTGDVQLACKRRPVFFGILLFLLAAQLIRLFFGVDVTDESYYFTNALRMTQGDRLFADIWDSTQTQGLVLYPVYALHTALFGTNGLLLLNRLLFFLLTLCTAGVLYSVFKTGVRPVYAAGCAVLLVVFAPASLYAVGYNQLAYCLCFLGCGLFLLAVRRSGQDEKLPMLLPALSGFVHGLMVASYPVDALLILPLLGVLLLYGRRAGKLEKKTVWRLAGLYCIGAALVAVPFLCYLMAGIGIDNLLLFVQGVGENPSTTSFVDCFIRLGRMGRQAVEVLSQMRFGWALALCGVCGCGVAVAVGIAAAREARRGQDGATAHPLRYRRVLLVMAGVYALCCIPVARLHVNQTVQTQAYMQYITFLTPLFYFALPKAKRQPVNRLLLGLGVPSLLLFLLNSMASGGGFHQSRYGLIGLFLVEAVLLCSLLDDMAETGARVKNSSPEKGKRLILLVPVFLSLVLLGLEYGYVYCENPSILSCDTRVTAGAGAGLYTTSAQAEMLNSMAADMDAVAEGSETLLCLDCFSYGYGLTDKLKPCASSTWMVSAFAFQDWGTYDAYWTNFFTYCKHVGREPDIILYAAEKPFEALYDENYSLHPYIRENYTCVIDRPDYQIFRHMAQKKEQEELS